MALRLIITTATTSCSVALLSDTGLLAEQHDDLGRGHAERLIPMIASLPDGGRADDIYIDCGPGSFTGVRIGLATARALGLGWGVPVHGFSSLVLLAAAYAAMPDAEATVAVAIPGGHGELFVQRFGCVPFRDLSAVHSWTAEAAAQILSDTIVLGSGAPAILTARNWGTAHEATARAADFRHLPQNFTTLPCTPIYGRAPDAKPAAA